MTKTREEYCAERPKRFVVCAANKYGSGDIFIGIRHFCPLMIKNMEGYDISLMRKLDGEIQGFVDQYGVFMDRQEAAIVAAEAGQLDRYGDNKPTILFSEDLY